MRLCEAILVAVAIAIAAVTAWAAAGLESEPFYRSVAVFTAAFWGALAGCGVWSRICERRDAGAGWRATIIWPHGRRP